MDTLPGPRLSDFIFVMDNVLPSSKCQQIIELFENDKEHWEESKVGNMLDEQDYRNAIEMNVHLRQFESKEWEKVFTFMNGLTSHLIKSYYQYLTTKVGCPEYIKPEATQLEAWRMHKYEVGKHFYKSHIDAADVNSSKRILSIMFYLNDVEQGGETALTHNWNDFKVEPKQGRVLVLPTWLGFPHEAVVPISNDKYLLKTYLHWPS